MPDTTLPTDQSGRAISLYRGRLVPGVSSSPLLIAASLLLHAPRLL